MTIIIKVEFFFGRKKFVLINPQAYKLNIIPHLSFSCAWMRKSEFQTATSCGGQHRKKQNLKVKEKKYKEKREQKEIVIEVKCKEANHFTIYVYMCECYLTPTKPKKKKNVRLLEEVSLKKTEKKVLHCKLSKQKQTSKAKLKH